MRDIIIIVSVCAAAIIIGAALYFFGPESFRVLPTGVQPAATMPIPETHVGPVEFVVVDEGATAAQVAERKNYLVNGTEEFGRLWTMVYGDTAPPAPQIDFSSQDVIAVFMGEQPSGGYSIAVSGIEDTPEARVVSITLTKPGEGCMTTQAITSPYQLVRVPVSGLPLTKTYAEETVDCE